jgi:hypothetical protein
MTLALLPIADIEVPMSLWLGLMFAVACAAFGILYRKIKSKPFRDISDDEFFELLSPQPGNSKPDVLRQRDRVARILGISPSKCSPRFTPEELSKNFEYFAEFSVAWSDLVDELHLKEKGGVFVEPKTLGELITRLAKA